MLKIEKDIKVWVSSDFHYGHKNICRGVTDWRLPDGSIPISQTRDFRTVSEMNDVIVNNINSVVGQDDALIFHGDWSFGGFDNVKILRDRIFCRNIHLIFGNHDTHIERNRGNCQSLFTSTQDFLRLEYMNEVFECFHFPIRSWHSMSKGRAHLFGHTHLSHDKKILFRSMDVGLDGHPEFRPYDLHREIIPLMKKQPIGSELGLLDHHTDGMKNVIG